MTKSRERLLAVVTVLGVVTFVLVAAELVLRFLPVATGMHSVAVTTESPVFRFEPNRNFVFSRDWDLALANRGRVNNAGFVNGHDYHKSDATPVLAVIGDSYIEAAMVPYPDTLHGRLTAALSREQRVYSFGASGAPLSQYLIWARHAVQQYGAQALVINVVGNDFDESHAVYKTGPGFWHYVPDADGVLRLRLFEYRPGRLRELVYVSALARYLIFNLQLGVQLDKVKSLLFGGPAAQATYAGNTAADASRARVRDSLAAIDAFFRDLPEYAGVPPARILFVMDGSRYPDVAAASAGTFFDIARKAFLAKAHALGYEAIDLDPLFFDQYRRNGERFEFDRDGHWNSIGHRVAFNAVMASQFLTRLVPVRFSSTMTLSRME